MFLILIISTSCISHKNAITIKKCKVHESENLSAFDDIYINLENSDLYKNVMLNFENTDSGIFYYEHHGNSEFGRFILIKKIDENYICTVINSNSKRESKLNKNDTNNVSEIISTLEKRFYLEQCENTSIENINLLMIKSNNEIIAKYFSFGELNFQTDLNNYNLNKVKKTLEIVYRNSFK